MKMLLDFTDNLKLTGKSSRIYNSLRLILYISALLAGVYLLYLIVLPNEKFSYSFANPDSTRNTVDDVVENKGALSFFVSSTGHFSDLSLKLNQKKDLDFDGKKVTIRKSYKSFLYPEGDPIGFKDGSLVKNEGKHFIVSDGKLRLFTGNSLESLKFNKESFIEIAKSDFAYNEPGDPVQNNEYPSGAIFQVDDFYYILSGQKLKKFVSTAAYLSHYDSARAIAMTPEIFHKYPPDEENIIGFSDGSLIAYGDGAYVISANQVLPINNAVTFEAMGYDWSDLIQASADEFSLYEKAKLFRINSPHPNGTVFKTDDNNRLFIVSDGRKRSLPSKAIADSWLKRKPVIVSGNIPEINCSFTKTALNDYYCNAALDNFENAIGKDYAFEFNPDVKIDYSNIEVNYSQDINWKNIRLNLGIIFNRIRNNYVPQAAKPI